ncbi:UNVERIFIED_CONTAM: hypothetical protein K2H54_043487 [Gekko kuhli]
MNTGQSSKTEVFKKKPNRIWAIKVLSMQIKPFQMFGNSVSFSNAKGQTRQDAGNSVMCLVAKGGGGGFPNRIRAAALRRDVYCSTLPSCSVLSSSHTPHFNLFCWGARRCRLYVFPSRSKYHFNGVHWKISMGEEELNTFFLCAIDSIQRGIRQS